MSYSSMDITYVGGGRRIVGGRKEEQKKREWERTKSDGGRRERKKMSHLEPSPLEKEPNVLSVTISFAQVSRIQTFFGTVGPFYGHCGLKGHKGVGTMVQGVG